MSEDRCRPVEIDGETIRVRGAGQMDEQSQAALGEVIRAVKQQMEDECQKPHLSGHDAAIIQRALDTIPATCRYHGDNIERERWGRPDACCGTGVPSMRRRQAEAALKRARGDA